MPIPVEIEGKGVVAEFPDGTDPTLIDSVIKRDFFSQQPAPQQSSSFINDLKTMPVITEPGTDMVPTSAAPKAIAKELSPYAPIVGATVGGMIAAPANAVAPGAAEIPGSVVRRSFPQLPDNAPEMRAPRPSCRMFRSTPLP